LKTIEIIDGNIDLVVYNENDSFYFYRFKPNQILGERIPKEVQLVSDEDVDRFLRTRHGKTYSSFIDELSSIVDSTNMRKRYDM
jgi:hypothetical protein